MKHWNDTIMQAANTWQAMDPVPYVIDGGLTKSGVLDVSRQVKERIKAFAYAYRVTGQTMWVDRTWKEIQVRLFSCSYREYFADDVALERLRPRLYSFRNCPG